MRSRAWLVTGGIGIVLVTTVLPFGAGRGEAQSGALTFTAGGAAYGAQLKVTSPAAPVSDAVVDAGGPKTNAVLDSVGGSRAYGSFPFPGELAATAPGLVRGLGNLPVPDYPFYAASYHPAAPKQEFSAGGVVLRAQSSENLSAAVASVAGFAQGPDGTDGIGLSRSESLATSGPEGVVAKAESVTAGVRLGQLTLGSVVSAVQVTLSPDGSRRRSASLQITGVEIGDQAVTTSQKGVVVGDEAVPGSEPEPLIAALAGAGFNLRITPASKTETGIDAPALSVSRVMDSGETITLNVGAASAGIDSPDAVDEEAGTPGAHGALPASPVASPEDPEPPAAPNGSGRDVADSPDTAPSSRSEAPPSPWSQEATAPLVTSSGRGSFPAAAGPSPSFVGGHASSFAAGAAPGQETSGRGEIASPPNGSSAQASAARSGPHPLWAEMIVRASPGSPLFGIFIVGGVLAVGMTAGLSRKLRSAS